MRILLSIHDTFDINTGGPGVTWRLGNTLKAHGHEVDYISFNDMNGPNNVKRFWYPCFTLAVAGQRPAYDVYDFSAGDGWMLSYLKKQKKWNRSVIIARSHGLEHITHDTIIATSERLSWKYPLYNGSIKLWQCKQSYVKADAALFLNNEERDYAVKNLRVSPERAFRIKNGIGQTLIDHASKIKNHIADHANRKNIAYVGRYHSLKGVSVLRDALVPIMKQDPSVKVGFFGTIVENEMVYKDYPTELHDRIFVTQRFKNEDLPRLLYGYGTFAFPSIAEGFGMALVEAMACGLVPIAVNGTGPRDIVNHEQNGYLIDFNANALEHAILTLFARPDVWSNFRKNAINSVDQYSWENVTNDVERIYNKFRLEKAKHFPSNAS